MLQLVLGDVLQNHQQFCIDDIYERLEKKAIKKVFYIVPDHIKFDAEVEVLKGLKQRANRNGALYANVAVEVYSFSRLAWYLLKDTSLYIKAHISQNGLQLLVRYLLIQKTDTLMFYRGQHQKDGFVERLCQLFMELRSGNIDNSVFDDFLKADIVSNAYEQNRHQKIQELSQLYQTFNEALVGQFIEKEDIYDALAQHVQQHNFSDTAFYFHGFEQFSAKEMQIVLAMMTSAKQVTVTLPLQNPLKTGVFDPIAHIPGTTYQQLLHYAKQLNVAVDIKHLGKLDNRHTPEMQQFVTEWANLFQKPVKSNRKPIELHGALTITPVISKFEEVETVARLIRELVATEQYKFSDFYVLMRQVEAYETILKPHFEESHIPFFFDNAAEMVAHPLVEVIGALKDIQRRNWQYRDVMQLLRTQLLAGFEIEAIDAFDNELIVTGYAGEWCYDNAHWKNEALKNQLLTLLQPYFEQIEKAQTMKDGVIALYQWIEHSGVKTTLLQWRNRDYDNGKMYEAMQQEQVWQTFINLLDECVDLLGHLPFEATLFYQIIQNGFEKAEFNVVPPSLDQVTIASIDGKRSAPKKVTIIIGATDQQFPKWYDNDTLLTNQERQLIKQVFEQSTIPRAFQLDSTYRTRVEPYVAWQLFASATEKVYIFYPQNESEPSAYIQLLHQYFSVKSLKTNALYGVGQSFVRKVINQLAYQYRQNERLLPLDQLALQVLKQRDDLNQSFQLLKQAFSEKNVPEPLTNALELYKGDLYVSTSRLENFFKDPYGHFLKYGLGLKERQKAELDAAKIGDIYHRVIDKVFRTAISNEKQLRDYSNEALQTVFHTMADEVFQLPEFQPFQYNLEWQFSKKLMLNTLNLTLKQLHLQSKATKLDTIKTEWNFSTLDSVTNLMLPTIKLFNNRALHLRGIIDRVDVFENVYSVVDYKTSDRKFSPEKFISGVSLQLMVYLMAMAQHFPNKRPLGAFYRTVGMKIDTVDAKKNKLSEVDDVPNKLVLMDGAKTGLASDFVTVDPNKQLFQVLIDKNGEFTQHKANAKLINADSDLPVYFDYLQYKIQEAGTRILSGDITLAPIKGEAFTPSLTEYQAIARFDATLRENQYRNIEKVDDPLAFMQLILGGKHDDNLLK